MYQEIMHLRKKVDTFEHDLASKDLKISKLERQVATMSRTKNQLDNSMAGQYVFPMMGFGNVQGFSSYGDMMGGNVRSGVS